VHEAIMGVQEATAMIVTTPLYQTLWVAHFASHA